MKLDNKAWFITIAVVVMLFLAGCSNADQGAKTAPAPRAIGNSPTELTQNDIRGQPMVCGDGTCDPDESCYSCSSDCGCEEGSVCDSSVSQTNNKGCVSEEDIGKPVCGDGTCDPDESCNSCEADCGCVEGETCARESPDSTNWGCYTAICGNGVCEQGEGCDSCIYDCGCDEGTVCDARAKSADDKGCVPRLDTCGNSICEEGEYCYNCYADCACTALESCSEDNPGKGCKVI